MELKESRDLLEKAELRRCQYVTANLLTNRKKYAQFFTPLEVASFLASLTLPIEKERIRILDPGAGTGILIAALINHLLNTCQNIKAIDLIAVEIDQSLSDHLFATLKECSTFCEAKKIRFSYKIVIEDFLELSYDQIQYSKQADIFLPEETKVGLFDVIILNPPYKKINNSSRSRKILNALEEETTNLYTAFLIIAKYLLETSGQIIAITPRSFCNGTYYKRFRNSFFSSLFFHKIHVYTLRDKTFSEDGVLQENLLFVVSPQKPAQNLVSITNSESPQDLAHQTIKVNHDLIIVPQDKSKIIHIITDEYSVRILEKISLLKNKLEDIGISVSTGKVVDFRIGDQLVANLENNSTALFYPFHFSENEIVWPRYSVKKKEAIAVNDVTLEVLIKSGYYTFCKRFSSKEEKKRIVAAFFDADKFNFELIGVENHLNYFHINNNPLTREIAVGLTNYLNSTIVDQYFRLFNGHTQVNAEDMRYIPIPDIEKLERLGNYYKSLPNQEEIDSLVEKELFNMARERNPLLIKEKIDETIIILKQLGLPKDQQNERSALTLLALLNLKPYESWSKSKANMIGITPIMNFIKEFYQKEYAPNTRETIRRQTIHQFVQAGIVIPNPDKPRAINSPNYVYKIEAETLELIKSFKTNKWTANLEKYLAKIKTLSSIYKQERDMQRIQLNIAEEIEIYLSSGGQNKLIEKVVKEFCPCFTPKAKLIYIGDSHAKWAFFDEKSLSKVGVKIKDLHGKMPDVIVHYKEKNWLVLIEAVTSHGPIDPKRKIELEELFKDSKAGLVFITTFLDKKTMMKYFDKTAWETDIWVADNPTHLVHLNGKRFLGPYIRD
jgi:adenine-specific DNA-methyltransferase